MDIRDMKQLLEWFDGEKADEAEKIKPENKTTHYASAQKQLGILQTEPPKNISM